jgi:hypothetical protein
VQGGRRGSAGACSTGGGESGQYQVRKSYLDAIKTSGFSKRLPPTPAETRWTSHAYSFLELYERRAVFVVLGQEGTIMSQVPWLEKFMDRAHMTLLERVGRLVNTILHALEHVEGDDARIGAVLPMFHRVRMEMDRIKQQYEDESVPEHVEHMRGLQEKLKERVQRMYHSHR